MANNQAGKPLIKREVAGSFIFKLPRDWPDIKRPQVALFRRSDKVRTYRHRYGPVAGSVEADDENPLATAWREIHEETTLTPESLELFRQGKPYSFVDNDIGREWTINPFSFRLKPPAEGGRGEAGITIDWEHDGWEWFEPASVTDDPSFGVARLTDSLRRCWFEYDLGPEVGGILSDGLEVLKNDHQSGARQLAAKALDTLVTVAGKLPTESKEWWWRHLRMSAWHLWKNGRESMGAATLNVMIRALEAVESKLIQSSDDGLSPGLVKEIIAELQQYGEQRQQATNGIWKALEQVFQSSIVAPKEASASEQTIRILTLSSSSTIAACLARAMEEFHLPFDIRILESRPLFEGVSLAVNLISRIPTSDSPETKTTVTLYTDAAAAVAAANIDVLLIGADILSPTGDVSNKMGSLPAVLAAKHASPTSKILVLAEKEKILPFPPPAHAEENDPREVTRAWGDAKTLETSSGTILQWTQKEARQESSGKIPAVKNQYFEWVPADLIDHYVFEDGIRTSRDLAKLADDLKTRFHRLFDGI